MPSFSKRIIAGWKLFSLLTLIHITDRDEDEPPPEPAPPEVPPRAQSLLASIKKLSSHTIKMDENGDLKHEEFIPSNQHGKSINK